MKKTNSKQLKTWGHFYENSGDPEYYRTHVHIHQPFLDRVEGLKPSRVLEAGCGSSIMSVYFSKKGMQVTALDRDRDVLAKAKKSSDALGGNVQFEEGDLFALPFENNAFDVSFSQGVLEHFENDAIQKIVKEQLRCSQNVWISVPSRYYKHQDFGDERLLTDQEWRSILEPVGSVFTEYYFYQRVKRNFLFNKPLMLMIGVTHS